MRIPERAFGFRDMMGIGRVGKVGIPQFWKEYIKLMTNAKTPKFEVGDVVIRDFVALLGTGYVRCIILTGQL